jgi:hypothetical protein
MLELEMSSSEAAAVDWQCELLKAVSAIDYGNNSSIVRTL